jgi:predicted PurR-regulated permease PerM
LQDVYAPILWPALIGAAAYALGSWVSRHGFPAGASPTIALALQLIGLSAAAALAMAFIERGAMRSAYSDVRAYVRGRRALGDPATPNLPEP